MATWAVGDIQGCAEPFFRLLHAAKFNPNTDTLWVAGDMVNRGPDNLSVLRFIKNLGQQAKVVLGNHDLHLMAASEGARKPSHKDTITDVLCAHDSDELLHWLRAQPLAQSNAKFVMTHAGIPHIWRTEQTLVYANEVLLALADTQQYRSFLANMYGNQPNCWTDQQDLNTRLRLITNYLTRMRFISPLGALDFTAKEDPAAAPIGFAPWYLLPCQRQHQILFGHWAALGGKSPAAGIHALDTGCVWGQSLTLMNLETTERLSVPAHP